MNFQPGSRPVIRSRAPLRLGLAGGGSDVAPFSVEYGGAVLNVTIDRYAWVSIEPIDADEVQLRADDLDREETHPVGVLPIDTALKLHCGVYNRMIRDYNDGVAIPARITSNVDSPMGSGLGSSSALVVALVVAMAELTNAPLGEYDRARVAFEIEREDLGLKGGKQDQYAAAFGGFNFMEFGPGDRTVINPLRMKSAVIQELESSLVLVFTGVSRESAAIIDHQSKTIGTGGAPLEAMHQLKAEAVLMKEALLFGDIDQVGAIVQRGWEAKKRTSPSVSNPDIERWYAAAFEAGALAGKVSGAGGGGFIMFLCDPARRAGVVRRLSRESGGRVELAGVTTEGAVAWRAPARRT